MARRVAFWTVKGGLPRAWPYRASLRGRGALRASSTKEHAGSTRRVPWTLVVMGYEIFEIAGGKKSVSKTHGRAGGLRLVHVACRLCSHACTATVELYSYSRCCSHAGPLLRARTHIRSPQAPSSFLVTRCPRAATTRTRSQHVDSRRDTRGRGDGGNVTFMTRLSKSLAHFARRHVRVTWRLCSSSSLDDDSSSQEGQ